MIYLGLLHLVLVLGAGLGFSKLQGKVLNGTKLSQLVVFIFAIVGKWLEFLPEGPLVGVYLLSAFTIPLFRKSIKEKDGYYLYLSLSFLYSAVLFKLPLSATIFSVTSLLLTLSLIYKDLLLFLLSVLSLLVVGAMSLNSPPLLEILSYAMILILPFGFFFHCKKSMNIRFLIIPTFLLHASLITNPLDDLVYLLFAIIYLINIFVIYSSSKQHAMAFFYLFFLSFKKIAPIEFMAVYFLFFGSIEILKSVFIESRKINFGEGRLEISYQNVIYLIFVTYLFSGTIYTPLSLIFGKLSFGELSLFFGVWLISIFKVILNIKPTEVGLGSNISEILIFISPVLVGPITDNAFSLFNPFPLVGYALTLVLVVIHKKNINLFSMLKDLVFKIRYFPMQKEMRVGRNSLTKLPISLESLKGPILELKLSFPITIGLLFLFWFLAIMGISLS